MTDEYNGWTNRATWNVALWLQNDFVGVLDDVIADKTVKTHERFKEIATEAFAESQGPSAAAGRWAVVTPDGERLEDANWEELFDVLVLEERKNKRDA